MRWLKRTCCCLMIAAIACLHPEVLAADPMPAATFKQAEGALQVSIGQQQIAEYVFQDDTVRRPYFKHLRTVSGVQVTRNHPPIQGTDRDDHPTMHPGLWLAFGDLNGQDFWRNKGRVRHDAFVEQPHASGKEGLFIVRNAYEAADGLRVCTEDCQIIFSPLPDGYLIRWKSAFLAPQDGLTFGDQEEMGLGLRLATPLAVTGGGEIRNSDGRRNEREVWGQQADWCAYGGQADGRQVGVVLMPGPRNFRRSWFHARDYGLLVANPFGQHAFTKGDKSRVTIPAGDKFTLEFGVLVFDVPSGSGPDIAAAYQKVAGG